MNTFDLWSFVSDVYVSDERNQKHGRIGACDWFICGSLHDHISEGCKAKEDQGNKDGPTKYHSTQIECFQRLIVMQDYAPI